MKNIKKFLLKQILRRENDKIKQPIFIYHAFLLPEEVIIFRTNPHPLSVIALETVLAVVGIILFKYIFVFLPEEISGLKWPLLLFGAIWGFVMTVIFFNWICIRYYLTNKRLIEERGIIGKRVMSIWLNRVQDITCSFGVMGRIFSFGDIEIESAGTQGKIVFEFLPAPRKFQVKIEKAILDFHSYGK